MMTHSKDIESFIIIIIDTHITSLKQDIATIEKKYFDGYIPFEQTEYINNHVFRLVETGIEESTLSILNTLETEIAIYKTFLEEDFIETLANIFLIYDYPHLWEKATFLILRAKYELALFSLAGISEKDYNRDIQTIKKDAERIAKYSEVTGSLSIPKKKSKIVSSLSSKLDKLFVYLNKEVAKDIIKTILNCFFDYRRMPSYTIATRPDGQKRNNKKNQPVVIKCVPAPKRKL